MYRPRNGQSAQSVLLDYKVKRDFKNYSNFEQIKPVLKGRVVVKICEIKGNYLILDEQGKLYSVGVSNKYGVLGRGFENIESRRDRGRRQQEKPASRYTDQID